MINAISKEFFFVLSPATVYVSKAGLPSFFAKVKAFEIELIIVLHLIFFLKLFYLCVRHHNY